MSDKKKWLDIGKQVASSGLSILGTALGGPAGGALGSAIAGILGCDSSPEEVEKALAKASPEQLVQVRQIEASLQEARLEAELGHHKEETKQITTVNETMQIEAATGHKWAGAWRPVWGFASAGAWSFTVVATVCVFGIMAYKEPATATGILPAFLGAMGGLMAVPLTILGVASHHRGKMQRVQAGERYWENK